MVIVVIVFVALLAPLLAPYDPDAQNLDLRLHGPSRVHWFGTDSLGRDVFSRLVFGTRVSLLVGTVAAAITIGIGSLIGVTTGYFGGRTDWALMRFTDVFMTIPVLFFMVLIVAAYGASTTTTIAVIGLVYWPAVARLVRSQVLSLRTYGFVEAARALGGGEARILLRHLFPNASSIVIVQGTLSVATAILVESTLSFLGLGVPPSTPSWGNVLTEGRLYLVTAWWIATLPGIAIFVTVLSFNLVGDGFRDALDPRLR
jgi:peptide/nickel transport system permease protein